MDKLISLRPYWNIMTDARALKIFIKIRPSDFYGEDVVFELDIEKIHQLIEYGIDIVTLVHHMGDNFIKEHYNPAENYYIEPDVLEKLAIGINQEIMNIYPEFFEK